MKRIWGIALFVGVGLLFAGVSEAKTVQHRVKCRPGYVRRTVWVPERRHGRIVRSYGMIVYARVQRCVKVNKPKPPSPPPVSVSTTGSTLLPSPFAPIGSPSPFAPPSPSPSPSASPSPKPPPPPPPPPPSSGDPVVVAVGDIARPLTSACLPKSCDQTATAGLAQTFNPNAVLILGDNQYESGSYPEYTGSYALSWGQDFNSIVHPVPGNHEYLTSGAAGYFQYFGTNGVTTNAPGTSGGYYSFNLGTWHIVALNSNCSNGCSDSLTAGATSAEMSWLASDLAANRSACVLAMWHQPLFSYGWMLGAPGALPLWTALYNAHADVVLNGHDHIYERYTEMNPSGGADPTGIREFVVGTGGESLNGLYGSNPPATLQANDRAYGVLVLTLHAASYDWKFVTVGGATVDSGTTGCHGPGAAPAGAVAARAATAAQTARLSGPQLSFAVRPLGASLNAATHQGLPVAVHCSRACDVTVTASLRKGRELQRIASFYETESQIPGPYSRILLRLPADRLNGSSAATVVLRFAAVDSADHHRVQTTTVSLRSR